MQVSIQVAGVKLQGIKDLMERGHKEGWVESDGERPIL